MDSTCSSADMWARLKLKLQLEAEAIFASTGEVIIIAPDRDSGSVMTRESRTGSLKVTFFPERNAVRWDSLYEYEVERIPEDITSLARTLIRRLRG